MTIQTILDFNESAFDNLTDMVLYWQRHINEVKTDERLLNLLLDDLKALNYKEVYIREL